MPTATAAVQTATTQDWSVLFFLWLALASAVAGLAGGFTWGVGNKLAGRAVKDKSAMPFAKRIAPPRQHRVALCYKDTDKYWYSFALDPALTNDQVDTVVAT